MREYEIVYILDSALSQEDVDARLEGFHATLGGEVTAVDHWGVRQLAYPIRKLRTGYYVVAQVTADPTALPEFERLVRLDEQTMRYLVVLNEGQPTSGASILAERHHLAGSGEEDHEEDDPEADDPDADSGFDFDADESTGAADTVNDGEGSEEGADHAGEENPGEEDGTADAEGADDEDESEQTVTSGPPIFSGTRGRRRRHEGPPIILLNYKDVATLSRFLTEQGRILPKRTTRVSARFQRMLGTAIKRARHLALLPYVRDHAGS